MNSEGAKNSGKSKIYEFDGYRLEAEKLLLFKETEVVQLAPKAVEVLLALVERGGQVISKEEMLERVWAETFVEEANLTHHISALRKALGENKNGRRYIETIPRRGYRFVTSVNEISNGTFELTITDRTTTHLIEKIEIETDIEQAQLIGRETSREHTLLKEFPKLEKKFQKRTAVFLLIALSAVIGGSVFVWLSFFRVSKTTNKISQPMTISRVTNSGKVGASTISPDGKFVVYSQNYTEGVGAVYVRQTDTNIETRLATHERGVFGMKSVSLDGAFVFYAVKDENNPEFAIFRVPILGGQAVRVFDKFGGAFFSLSPDSSRAVFYRADGEQKQSYVITAALDGSKAERVLLMRPYQEMQFIGIPAWSKDGKTIALAVRTAAASHNYNDFIINIMTLDIATGELRLLTNETWEETLIMCWMQDGSGVVLIGRRPNIRNQIYFVAFPSGEVRRVTSDMNGYGNFGLGITADGYSLVADVWEFQGRIWTMDASGDTNTATRLSAGDTVGEHGLTDLPDGRIVFSSRSNSNYDLWTIGKGDIEAKPLTSDSFYQGQPIAAHDGSFIVFTSDRAGTNQLFRINPDGSNLKQLTFGDSFNNTPDISPDGIWVVYHSYTYNPATVSWSDTIWKIPSEGGTPVQLTNYQSFAPTFSPDGKMISCIITTDNYQGKIAVIGADDGKPIKTFEVKFHSHAYNPAYWMPDGKSLIYRNVENQIGNLWKQNLSGGAPQRFTDFKSEYIYNFVFTRDGKHLLLSRGETVVNVVMLKNLKGLTER